MEYRPILAFVALFGLLASTAVVAEAYRWVDENGVVHYSDRPHPGAEEMELPDANVATTRRAYQLPATDASAEDAGTDEPFEYESIDVTAPGPEETLWNIEGVLNVTVSLTPGLQPGHQVRAYFDGGQGQVVQGTNFQLQQVWRGVHNIQVEVVDETGKLMIRSRPNRFYVQQNTVTRGR